MSDRLFQLEQEQQRLREQFQNGLSAAYTDEDTPQTNRLFSLEQSLTEAMGNQSKAYPYAASLSHSGYSEPFEIRPRGYSFVINNLAGPAHQLLPVANRLPPLTSIEIARLNEAIARAKQAAELARDCLIEIARLAALPSPRTQEQDIYVSYFGTFDQERVKKVRDNFIKLFNAFDAEPEVVDHRNTEFGKSCYAATRTKHLLPGEKAKVWIGRAFFSTGKPYPQGADKAAYVDSYASTSDATVGTLIHEFSHTVFHAVDAPPLDTNGNWKVVMHNGVLTPLTPNMTPGDNYGASPINRFQSSTRELDKRLASTFPDISVRNADNYGQFACEILLLKGQ